MIQLLSESRGPDTSGMCGNQTTSEMNTNHEQVQLCERDDAKVGFEFFRVSYVLDPGPIDVDSVFVAMPTNVLALVDMGEDMNIEALLKRQIGELSISMAALGQTETHVAEIFL